MSAADRLRALAAQLLAEADALERNLDQDDPEPSDDETSEWLDTATAGDRFGIPLDSLRRLAREKGMGEKRGGRWIVNADALRRYLG